MPAKPSSRPWRRFLRFSVRGLIVLVLVVGAGLGWIVRQAHIQRDAVAAIRRAGGEVEYDCYWSNGRRVLGGEPRAPRWLIDLIGGDYFHHITKVEFLSPASATDAKLAHVGGLSQLQLLSANYSPSVSDAGLAHLKGLTNLSILALCDTHASDTGLAYLKGLRSLSELNLCNTQVTDRGLAHLKALTGLSSLGLNGTQVTDAGLAHLTGLSNLSMLALSGTHASDTGLAYLKGLTSLSQLNLSNTHVTDAGLAHLTGLTNLTLPRVNIFH